MFIIYHKTIWNVNASVFFILIELSRRRHLRIRVVLPSCCPPSVSAVAQWPVCLWITTAAPQPPPPPSWPLYKCCCPSITRPQTCSASHPHPGENWRHIYNNILGVFEKRTLRFGWLLIEMERKEKMKWICDERSDRWRELCYWLVLFHRSAEERRLLWKLPNLSPTNHSKGHCCHLFILSFLFLSLIHDSCLTLSVPALKKKKKFPAIASFCDHLVICRFS